MPVYPLPAQVLRCGEVVAMYDNSVYGDDAPIVQTFEGGPVFYTEVLQPGITTEYRKSVWTYPLRSFMLDFGYPTPRAIERAMNEFFWSRGRGRAFRFRDYTDWYAGGVINEATQKFQVTTPISLGAGNGNTKTFQLHKVYTNGVLQVIRPIRRPDVDTISIYADSVQVTEGWTVNADTGIVMFTDAPGASVALTWAGLFDILARFDTDSMNMEILPQGAAQWTGVAFREVYDF